jgi:F-type H+-transporting ATPase subunit alpha
VVRFEGELFHYMTRQYPDIEVEIETKKVLSDELKKRLGDAILNFKSEFIKTIKR